jgi:hypothetical protein
MKAGFLDYLCYSGESTMSPGSFYGGKKQTESAAPGNGRAQRNKKQPWKYREDV